MSQLLQAASGAAFLVRPVFSLSYSWWVYPVSGAAYTAWIFLGELVKKQRRIFSKGNPRPVSATLSIHALFLMLLMEYIQAAPSLASDLPSGLTTPTPFHTRYLPPIMCFLMGVAVLCLIEWRWLYSGLPTKSTVSEFENKSLSSTEGEKRSRSNRSL